MICCEGDDPGCAHCGNEVDCCDGTDPGCPTHGPDPLAALSLDHATVAQQLAAPVHVPRRGRRFTRGAYGIGAGDVAKLMLALGRRPLDTAPAWLRDEVRPMARMGGESRFLLQKAGRVKRRKQGMEQRVGVRREAELFLAWLDDVETLAPMPLDVDPDSAVWAGALPDELPPWPDKECPRLCVRTDGWFRLAGDPVLCTLSLKCARYGYRTSAWWSQCGDEAPWWYEMQGQSEMAALNAEHTLIVVGCGWIRDPDDPRDDGPKKLIRVDRNDEEIREIRDAVREGWSRIEGLRAA